MNYGFAVSSDSGHAFRILEDEDSEIFSYQLHHFITPELKEIKNLN